MGETFLLEIESSLSREGRSGKLIRFHMDSSMMRDEAEDRTYLSAEAWEDRTHLLLEACRRVWP